MSNIYCHPEQYGLRTIGEIQFGEACYSFDLGVIWADGFGFYGAFDSGCSCPSPFENHSMDNLTLLASWHEVSHFLCERVVGDSSLSDSERERALIDIAELVLRARAAKCG